ncbi:hypothetical protein LJB76_01580 [Clostridia bacterium OttesenSCG-928-O13]|nr:hypothetical protein [Clostridia bacterium OttesenSCG-928-O13]
MKKCVVHQNDPESCAWWSFAGAMKKGKVFAYVPADKEPKWAWEWEKEWEKPAPAFSTNKYYLYSLEEYVEGTNMSREWYDIMIYEIDGRFGYVETKTGCMLTEPCYVYADPFYDHAENGCVRDELGQFWYVDRKGKRSKDAETTMRRLIFESLMEMDFDARQPSLHKRIKWELNGILEANHADTFNEAWELVRDSKRAGYPVIASGAAGSSIIAYFMGITDVNPLPPHYVCPSCHHHEWAAEGSVADGYDLPPEDCPSCGQVMRGDGHDLCPEFFLGLDGQRPPKFSLRFSPEYLPEISIKKDAPKADRLHHDVPTLLHSLEELTGIASADVPMNDKTVYGLLTSPNALGATAEEIGWEAGTLGIPELDNSFIQHASHAIGAGSFADLVKVHSLAHSVTGWFQNAEDLIQKGICSPSELIGARDDVMLYLMRKGIRRKRAFETAQQVAHGRVPSRGFDARTTDLFRRHGIPDWWMESCQAIGYSHPKAHSVSHMSMAVRLLWHKLYHPKEFYTVVFSACDNNALFEAAAKGKEAVSSRYFELQEKMVDRTDEELTEMNGLRLVNECLCRGVILI